MQSRVCGAMRLGNATANLQNSLLRCASSRNPSLVVRMMNNTARRVLRLSEFLMAAAVAFFIVSEKFDDCVVAASEPRCPATDASLGSLAVGLDIFASWLLALIILGAAVLVLRNHPRLLGLFVVAVGVVGLFLFARTRDYSLPPPPTEALCGAALTVLGLLEVFLGTSLCHHRVLWTGDGGGGGHRLGP